MDRREAILLKEFDVESEDCQTWAEDIQLAITFNPDIDKIKNAMDENGKRLCLELLEYMAVNEYKCYFIEGDDGCPYYFFRRGSGYQNLSKEQLFENFL